MLYCKNGTPPRLTRQAERGLTMRSFLIRDNRTFMASLFTGTLFDHMETESVQIVTAYTLRIDGRSVPAFYTAEEIADMPEGLPGFTKWDRLRGLCFSAIKGKKAPVFFQIIFHADPGTLTRLTSSDECSVDASFIQALALTIRYESGVCRLTTGTALSTFLPDQSPDRLWDSEMQSFLSENRIDFAVQ